MNEQLKNKTVKLVMSSNGGTGKTVISKIISDYLLRLEIKHVYKINGGTKTQKFNHSHSKRHDIQITYDPFFNQNRNDFIKFKKNTRRIS